MDTASQSEASLEVSLNESPESSIRPPESLDDKVRVQENSLPKVLINESTESSARPPESLRDRVRVIFNSLVLEERLGFLEEFMRLQRLSSEEQVSTIHTEVAEVPRNAFEIACQPWDDMEWCGPTNSTTSRISSRVHVLSFRAIQNFHSGLQRFVETNQSLLEADTNIRSLMTQTPFTAQSERDLQSKLDSSVFLTMNNILAALDMPVPVVPRLSSNHRSSGMTGRADGYCVAHLPGNKQQTIAVIETKTPALSHRGTCVLSQIDEHTRNDFGSRMDALDACQQVASYAIQARTPYGFITTYGLLWCFFFDKDGVMHISPGFLQMFVVKNQHSSSCATGCTKRSPIQIVVIGNFLPARCWRKSVTN